MSAITTAVGEIMEMILSIVTDLFVFVTNTTPAAEGGVAFGHFFFIGLTIGLILTAINLIKRLVYGA
jgi:hypothetical protein